MLRKVTDKRAENTLSAHNLVTKKDTGWKTCGIYRTLNTRTNPDRYPVPNIQDYSHRLSDCTTFSRLNWLRLTIKFLSTLKTSEREKSPQLSAFLNFLSCPLVYVTTTKTFNVSWMRSLKTWISLAYIDNILVFSRSPQEHDQQLHTITKLRHPAEPFQLCFPWPWNFISGIQYFIHIFPAHPGTYHLSPGLYVSQDLQSNGATS